MKNCIRHKKLWRKLLSQKARAFSGKKPLRNEQACIVTTEICRIFSHIAICDPLQYCRQIAKKYFSGNAQVVWASNNALFFVTHAAVLSSLDVSTETQCQMPSLSNCCDTAAAVANNSPVCDNCNSNVDWNCCIELLGWNLLSFRDAVSQLITVGGQPGKCSALSMVLCLCPSRIPTLSHLS